jgi:uncharacterized glyoxalase superfamily protein PhnB
VGRALSASLTAKDIQASLIWYRDVVGFTVARNFEREGKLFAVSLQAGDVRILLTQDDGSKGFDRAKGEGFSLMITTDQNIDELAKQIKELGGTACERFVCAIRMDSDSRSRQVNAL